MLDSLRWRTKPSNTNLIWATDSKSESNPFNPVFEWLHAIDLRCIESSSLWISTSMRWLKAQKLDSWATINYRIHSETTVAVEHTRRVDFSIKCEAVGGSRGRTIPKWPITHKCMRGCWGSKSTDGSRTWTTINRAIAYPYFHWPSFTFAQ